MLILERRKFCSAVCYAWILGDYCLCSPCLAVCL